MCSLNNVLKILFRRRSKCQKCACESQSYLQTKFTEKDFDFLSSFDLVPGTYLCTIVHYAALATIPELDSSRICVSDVLAVFEIF